VIFKGAAALLALFVPLSMSTATAEVVASHASPGALLNVNISLDNDGGVMYSVTHKRRAIIEPSQLGFAGFLPDSLAN